MRKESELESLDIHHLKKDLDILHKRRQVSLERYPDKQNEDSEKVYQLRQKFIRASILMTEDEAVICTKLFVEHIAGVNWNDEKMLEKVGRNCNGVGTKALDDGATFWRELHGSVQDFLTDDEANWLIEKDVNGVGAFELLCRLDSNHPSALEPSAVVSHIWWWK